MKSLIICLSIVALIGCATAPKVAVDPYKALELAVVTEVTAYPESKSYILQAINDSDKMVDSDVVAAVNLLISKFSSMERYKVLVGEALYTILANAQDLKLKPEVQTQLRATYARLQILLQ